MLNHVSKQVALLIVSLITLIIAIAVVFMVGPFQSWCEKIPLGWALVVSLLTYLFTAVWAWLRSREYVLSGAKDGKRWRDLRLWAIAFMLIMAVVYIIF
ncbi:MAG: hypothetical protein ACOY90_14980 [Candidatus Zhuqueibacterota bacterium]